MFHIGLWCGTGRLDGGAVGAVGAAVAGGEEAAAAAGVVETAAHRRYPVADPGRGAVAGCAGAVRAVADGVWAVSAVAARWHLAADRDWSAGPGGRRGVDHLGGQRGLHGGAGAPARRWRA